MQRLIEIVEKAWEDRSLLNESSAQNAINEVIELLDKGHLRVAEPTDNGWQVNEWVKKAVVLYFPIRKMEKISVGPFEFYDKMVTIIWHLEFNVLYNCIEVSF